ncbi:MAG: STAS domain-containing protein [Spirochaetes bacterium]|nr:STAS domain-containing protein [Spirochaetota bacterium]
MNSFGIDNVITEKATVELSDISNGMKVTFSGDIDVQNPEPIFVPFFEQIHNKVLENSIKYVELDFSKLTFLNSSGIKTLIKWITKVTPLPIEKKYRFKIVANSEITWQETSLKMLSMLAPGLIEIQIK